jgi:hypothetical protein
MLVRRPNIALGLLLVAFTGSASSAVPADSREEGGTGGKTASDAGSKRSSHKPKVDEWFFCAQKSGSEKLVRTGPFPDELSCNEQRAGQIASGDQAGICMPAGQINCRSL